MINDLLWTDRALTEYDNLLDYLLEKWGEAITLRVIGEINQKISQIKKFPEHFPVFLKGKQIRRCVASPQTSIFFHIKGDVIEIISLFDNRQNPQKRKL